MSNKFKKLDFADKNYKLVEQNKIWFILPIIILVVAAAFFSFYAIKDKKFARGMNLGIDFTGGTILTVPIGDNAEANYEAYVTKIKDIVTNNGTTVSYDQLAENTEIQVRYSDVVGKSTDEMKLINDKIKTEVAAAFPEYYKDGILISDNTSQISVDNIGATISSELIANAFISIGVTFVLILIYIIIRFEWLSGVTALIALIHDVIMMFAFTIIFRIQMNSSFVAAVITIIAYSINDTIVVFDRVRENMNIAKSDSYNINKLNVNQIVNRSVLETLNRSLYTNITTLFTVITLAIFGSVTIRELTIPLLFGLVCGSFSTLFIAPTLYALIKDKMNKKKSYNYSAKAVTATAKK
jgi:preprotein translocase subunit SecF